MKNSFHSDNFICLINATSQALTLSNDLTQSPSASHSRLIRKMHHIGCIRLIFWVHPIGSVSPTIAEFTEVEKVGRVIHPQKILVAEVPVLILPFKFNFRTRKESSRETGIVYAP